MVTLNHIIEQLERQRAADAKKFQRYVHEGRMNHYTRDSKLSVWDGLIERCKKAKAEKILLKDALKDIPL